MTHKNPVEQLLSSRNLLREKKCEQEALEDLTDSRNKVLFDYNEIVLLKTKSDVLDDLISSGYLEAQVVISMINSKTK
jgi:hypothetical protein